MTQAALEGSVAQLVVAILALAVSIVVLCPQVDHEHRHTQTHHEPLYARELT